MTDRQTELHGNSVRLTTRAKIKDAIFMQISANCHQEMTLTNNLQKNLNAQFC